MGQVSLQNRSRLEIHKAEFRLWRLTTNPDLSSALPFPLQGNLHIPLSQEARELFSPLDQQNAVICAQIV